jgi:uncharacterized protein (DUF362 family)
MHSNRLTDDDGRALVSQITVASPEPGYSLRTPFNGWALNRPVEPDARLIEAVHLAVEAIGGFAKIVRPGDRITIKPNFNSGDPPPNSTDIPFLATLIRLLRDYGAGQIVVGESTRHPPTNARFEMQRTGVFDACRRAGADVVVFGDEHWTPVRTRGERFGWVEVARPMLECDRLIYACCLKTHWLTKFSMSLKLIVGAIRPRHRARLHFGGQIEARVAELASVVQPDLVLIDGRSAFVRGGPCYGVVRRPNVILASGDRIAADTAAIDVLRRYPECSLTDDPWHYRQIREAVRLKLGIRGPDQRRSIAHDLRSSARSGYASSGREAGSRPA